MAPNFRFTPEEFQEQFVEVVREAAAALFSTVDDRLRPVADPALSPDIDSAGVVGFVGPDIRGMFSVAMAGEEFESLSSEDHQDWVGELANQLAGRVKNRLGRMGITYDVAPPATLRGQALTVATRDTLIQITFRHPSAACIVQAVVKVERPLELAGEDDGQHRLEEGDLLLF
jgi:CheY-specific phosphatase CheX